MADCRVCNDEGTFKGCKKCGKVKSLRQEIKAEVVNLEANGVNPSISKLFDSAELQLSKSNSAKSANMLNSYCTSLQQIVDNASEGAATGRSVVISAPDGFGKGIAINSIRYYYAKHGIKVSRIKTLEEFIVNYQNLIYCKEKSLAFIESIETTDIIILKILNPDSSQIKASFSHLCDFCSAYRVPFILSTSLPINKLANDLSIFKHNYSREGNPFPIICD